MKTEERCACGRKLHYSNKELENSIRAFIAELGPEVKVIVDGRAWLVQRHYIALHGIKACDLPSLGFKEVSVTFI